LRQFKPGMAWVGYLFSQKPSGKKS
jgi:hypothetical protein